MRVRARAVLACLAAIAAILGLTTLPADAARPRPISRCGPSNYYGFGQVITRDSYLTRNLSCKKGFVLAAGATLDLRGHTLTGLPDPLDCAGCPGKPDSEQPRHPGVTLRDGSVINGRIKGWTTGVRVLSLDGAAPTETRSVRKVVVTDNEEGLYIRENTDTVVVSNSVFKSNGYGIHNWLTAGGLKIDGTRVTGNTKSGLFVESATELKVTHSLFGNNNEEGLYGVEIAGPVLLYDNQFNYNGRNGAVISATPGPVAAGDNSAFGNRRAGMIVGPNAVDLGGNRAAANIGGVDCQGVVCGLVPVPPEA